MLDQAKEANAVIASNFLHHPGQDLSKAGPSEAVWGFLYLFIPLAVALIVVFAAFEYMRMNVQQVKINIRESGHVELGRNSVVRDLESLGSDLLVLANGETIKRVLNDNTPGARLALADRFLIFSKDRRHYDQIRYIDELGMEVVRVNFNDGAPMVVVDNKLQRKSRRYYFTDTLSLSPGQVFLSRLDLNVENKTVEVPYKPMLRLGTPVFDSNGRKKGVVILNYLAAKLLKQFALSMPGSDNEIFVVNRDGYWLHSSNPGKEWGFMFGSKHTFATAYPEAWKNMSVNDSDQFQTDDGLFTFATIYPNQRLSITAKTAGSSTDARDHSIWKIGRFVRAEKLNPFFNWRERVPDMIIFALLLLVTATASWSLSLARNTRRRAEVELRNRTKNAELLERAAAAAKEEAEKASNAKSEFLASMSHELRTPLNAIMGFSEMLTGNFFGPLGSAKYEEYVEDIHASSEHLLHLINDILDLSAIEAGKHPLAKESLNVNELIEDCSTIIVAGTNDKSVMYSVEVTKNTGPLYADRRAMKQILFNVLSNAIKFTPEGGLIALKVSTSNGHHVFEVSDTGKGIPEKKLPSLTDPFVRIEDDPYKAQKGTGLGLAIVKSLVDLHEGELIIESEVGKGTVVTIILPSSAPKSLNHVVHRMSA